MAQTNGASLAQTNGAHGETGAVAQILVVDDDPNINRLVRVRLETRGYQVATAANGEEALAAIAHRPPDLMFLDVSLPGIDGLAVLDRVRGQKLDLAVIMMTAFGSEQIAIEALRRGADDYLRKPFEPSEFRAVLDRTVSRLELTRQNAALRRQIEKELARAAKVQTELLPAEAPRLPTFELAARCLPARTVGGDFYDWLEPVPGIVSLTLGDVMGKGMPAALLMATVRAAMRAVVRHSPPGEAMRYVSAALVGDLGRQGVFLTLFHAQLNVTTHRLSYTDVGHGHVFVRRADGRVEELRVRGLPLGILEDEVYEEGSLSLDKGDALVVYSDGLVDARRDVELTPALIAAPLAGATSAPEMVERLIGLAAGSEPRPDDLTVLVLRCTAPLPPAADRRHVVERRRRVRDRRVNERDRRRENRPDEGPD